MKKIWSTTLVPGEKWSGNIGRGKYIHFKALGDNANVSMLMYNMRDVSERYNMPDTLKAQYTAYLTQGNVLMSDNGRVLASIVQDTVGWHDSLSGCTTRKMTDERYGESFYQREKVEDYEAYQEGKSPWYRCGEENFEVELVRNNMGKRDLVPCVNLFSKVYIKEDGSMHYALGNSKKGDTVTLRTDMDIIFIVSNTPNPLDKRKEYPSVPVQIEVYDAPEFDIITDECANKREENYRAFENTMDYYNLLGL